MAWNPLLLLFVHLISDYVSKVLRLLSASRGSSVCGRQSTTTLQGGNQPAGLILSKVHEHKPGGWAAHVSVCPGLEHGPEHEHELWERGQAKSREQGDGEDTQARSGRPGCKHHSERTRTWPAGDSQASGPWAEAFQREDHYQVFKTRSRKRNMIWLVQVSPTCAKLQKKGDQGSSGRGVSANSEAKFW